MGKKFKPTKTYAEIEAYLQEKELYVDDISTPLTGHLRDVVYDITITCGDWKHEHAYLKYLMEEIGYIETQEQLIYDEYTNDGDDCYSAVHRFVQEPFYLMFNGEKK